VAFIGCQQTSQKEKVYSVPVATGVERAKQLLQTYAGGQPVGSEAESFSEIVEQAREEDPEKAKILEEGFEQIKKNPQNPSGPAKQLLSKL
jgi:hypothetical protein